VSFYFIFVYLVSFGVDDWFRNVVDLKTSETVFISLKALQKRLQIAKEVVKSCYVWNLETPALLVCSWFCERSGSDALASRG